MRWRRFVSTNKNVTRTQISQEWLQELFPTPETQRLLTPLASKTLPQAKKNTDTWLTNCRTPAPLRKPTTFPPGPWEDSSFTDQQYPPISSQDHFLKLHRELTWTFHSLNVGTSSWSLIHTHTHTHTPTPTHTHTHTHTPTPTHTHGRCTALSRVTFQGEYAKSVL